MGFHYHAQALSQDVDTDSYGFGAANVAVVRRRLAERKQDGNRDPELEKAVKELGAYFDHMNGGLGEEARRLLHKQDIEGMILTDAEAATLEKAERRAKAGAKVTKAQAKRAADVIYKLTRGWGD